MDDNMNSGKEYSYFLKSGEDLDDAQKITRTRKVRSSIMTRVIRSESPSTSAESDSKRVLGYSTRQSRTRHTSEDESQKRAEMSRDFKEMTVPMHINDDFPDDENQPPYQDATELKRAQSEGDLLNGELKLSKLRTVRSVPLLERKVHFSSTEDDGGHTQRLRRRTEEEETSEGKRRSRSYDELSWKKPHIDVRRKVELLPQKETAKRSRSADYHGPRKGILKTKRITQTSTIRISGSTPTDNGMEHETTREEQTMPGEEKRTSTTEAEPMDYSTSSTTTSTRRPESQEKLFKLPKRYRVQQDINLEPEMKPKSMIFTRKWKSEPTLAFEKTQQRSRSMERLPSEKETKLSNVKIDLIKPIDLKPLKPAYSVGDLPFETAIRNEVKFHLKPQRWKSNPELASREKLTQQEMEDVHARKPIKEFETKIVRALPVHLQPLHQPTPAKESPVKATKVKDASMQFTSVQETKSEGTQAFFEPSRTKVSVKQVYKGTQTAGEKLTVPEPVVVEFRQSTVRKESPKVRRLKMVETSHDMKEPCIGEFDLSRIETIKEKEPSKKQETERLVVQYMPELEKPRREEPATVTTETCEEHATEVKLRKRSSESKKARRDIHIGRIDDLDMELATREEDYPEPRRVKKLKTSHIDYKPSSETSVRTTVRYVSEAPDKPEEQPSYRTYVTGEDMTFGRIESTRKIASTREKPTTLDRMIVEEIAFPRQSRSTVKPSVQPQHQQGLKRKKETTVRYEKTPKEFTKVTRQSTDKVGRFLIDETFKPQKKAKREPQVGRIEHIHMEEKRTENGTFPREQEIGSFLFKTASEEEKQDKVSFSITDA